jgi:prepilin-type N-terminal cleavage/methylation domain-containing protein
VKRGRRRGFTLIELIVSMALVAMLLAATSHVFATALTGRQRLRANSTELSAVRRAYDVIARDMHSGIVPPDDSGLEFGLNSETAGLGSGMLQFAAVNGDPLLVGRAANETSLIQYAVAEDPRTGRPTLWRYETPYPIEDGTDPTTDPDTRALPLLPGVIGASYLFYSEAEQNWVETWEDLTGLPNAIRMDVVFGEGREARRQESWVFQIPAARFANDEATESAAESEASGTGTPAGGAR